MAQVVLGVEGEANITSPSLGNVREVVARMTPSGGPGFLILEGRGDDYVQAAGGDGVFTVEWREHAGGGFRHWKAGLPGQADTGEVAVPTNGHEVRVRSHERLRAGDVVAILGAFLAGQGRPAVFTWRDMSDMFA